MQRTWLFPTLLLGLGWAADAEARRLPPGPAVVARAVDHWYACYVDSDCSGSRSVHRRLTSLRCQRRPVEEGYPGRILCLFSGYRIVGNLRRPEHFRRDCAYLMPIRRGWLVSSIPDADVCE